jgi:hypothetical protein
MIVAVSVDSLCLKRLYIKSDGCRLGVIKECTPGDTIT